MKISIITVCLNAEKHIEETIRSVLNQECEDFEYLIIDGGSTDSTLDIIAKYSDRLAYSISEPDKGLYDAMNKGIKQAKGDLIGIINADDYYYPGAFAVVNEAFKGVKSKFPESNLEDYIFWGDVEYEKQGRVKGFRPNNLKIGAFAPHPSMFCPRKVYDKIGLYDTSFKLLGDYDFMYRAIHKYKIKALYVSELIAFFREGGLADTHVARCLRDELKVKLKYGQSRLHAYPVYWLKLLKNVRRIQR